VIGDTRTGESHHAVPDCTRVILPVGIEHVEEMHCGEIQTPRLAQGTIALDGERELEYSSSRHVTVRLDGQGPYTIDIDKVMERAALEGLLAIG
jgi:hypothetical protein